LNRRFVPGVCNASIQLAPVDRPRGYDHDVYLVVDDLGRLGRVWREADYDTTDFETVITDLLTGQYGNPIGVFAFNTAEGWSRDVSADLAAELRRRCDLQLTDLPSFLQDFVDRHNAVDRSQLSLPPVCPSNAPSVITAARSAKTIQAGRGKGRRPARAVPPAPPPMAQYTGAS
jgi:hypothetical protein